MMYLTKLFFFVFCFFFVRISSAEIGVTPAIIDIIASQEQVTEVAVKNFDTKHKAYVEVTPYHLKNPGSAEPIKERVFNPEQGGLLVFPSKLVLLPGQTQFVRITGTHKKVIRESVYQVEFIPKTPSRFVEQNSPNGTAMGIQVIVGYGVRVTARPDIMSPALNVTRQKKQLIIKNMGNTQLKITSCTQLIKGKKTEILLPAYTVFAGQTLTKELATSSPVTMDVYVMDKQFGVFHTD